MGTARSGLLKKAERADRVRGKQGGRAGRRWRLVVSVPTAFFEGEKCPSAA